MCSCQSTGNSFNNFKYTGNSTIKVAEVKCKALVAAVNKAAMAIAELRAVI